MKNIIKGVKSVKKLNAKLLNQSVRTLIIVAVLISVNIIFLSTALAMTDWNWHLIVFPPSSEDTISFN